MISLLRRRALAGAIAIALLAFARAGAAPPAAASSGASGHSDQFTVSGSVVGVKTFDLAALKALPRVTATVGGTAYAGVGMWQLLDKSVGIATDPAVKNDILRKTVVATGSDGYQAVLSLGELDPAFGNQPDLIAYEADGKPLDANGFARLVVPNDVKGGRAVARLVSLQVLPAQAASPASNTDHAR